MLCSFLEHYRQNPEQCPVLLSLAMYDDLKKQKGIVPRPAARLSGLEAGETVQLAGRLGVSNRACYTLRSTTPLPVMLDTV